MNTTALLLVFAAAGLVGAGFLGMLAATADAVKIGIGAGLVLGICLLAVPRLVVWLVIALGLSTGALVSIAGPAYVKLPWAISLLSFILWPVALLAMLQQKRIPAFIWLSFAFVLWCVGVTALDWWSVSEFAAGFKRYFQAYGLLFALAALPFSWDDVRRWQKLMLGIALLQLPFALYEFIVLVPQRGGLAAGSEALDVVAGTFAANLTGGSANAEMAAFLLITIAFLTARWRAGLLSGARYVVLSVLCLIPLGLGETKIVVLLLPLVGFVLIRRDFFRSPMRFLPLILLFGVLTAVLAHIYVSVMMNSTFSAVIADTVRYNLENVGYGDALLNRSTVLSFWWDRHGWYDPIPLLFGHGIGSSYWAPTNPTAGHVGMHFPGYAIDLTTVATLLWDVGILGVLLFFAAIAAAWVTANRLWRRTDSALVRADVLAIQAALCIFVIYYFYGSSAVNLLPFQIVIASVFGYLAWLHRVHAGDADDAANQSDTNFSHRRY